MRTGENPQKASSRRDRNPRQGRRSIVGARHAHDHRAHEGADKLYALIDDMRICMMTTVDEQGRLLSRPMYALEPDEAGDLWFFTKLSSQKTLELRAEGRVNLAFSHPGKQHYVSVSGKARIVQDQNLMAQKWSEPMRTWFPAGLDDPELSLVRVHPETGEYWDSPSGAIMYLYGYAKAALTGDPPTELGETGKVDLR
jgi:general stress protein 26